MRLLCWDRSEKQAQRTGTNGHLPGMRSEWDVFRVLFDPCFLQRLNFGPGHPSCMELTSIGDIIRSYPWRCIECKICEVCNEKGDDVRIQVWGVVGWLAYLQLRGLANKLYLPRSVFFSATTVIEVRDVTTILPRQRV